MSEASETVTVESSSTRDYITVTRSSHIYIMSEGKELFDIHYKNGALIINSGSNPMIIKPNSNNQATIY